MMWKLPNRPGQWSLILAFFTVIGAAILLPREWDRYRLASEQVEISRQIIDSAEALLSAHKDAESGQRGFLITRDRRYLIPFDRAMSTMPLMMKSLTTLSADKPSLRYRVEMLARLTQIKMAELRHTLDLANQHDFYGALAI